MRRAMLIFLSLFVALVGWSTVCADDGFYVIPAMRGNYAPVPKTGQTVPHDQINIPPQDDGALKKGVAWPIPRFTDNNNGTVTDKLTGLIWMKNANAFGMRTWADAMGDAYNLHSDSIPGLTDGSKEGDWRLPNVRELQSLVDYKFYSPSLPNTLGTGQWVEDNPFQGVQSSVYWSSTTYVHDITNAWNVTFGAGPVNYNFMSTHYYVWCVRGGP